MDASVSHLLAAVWTLVILVNCANTIQQHTNSLESAIATLEKGLSYHSETLLRQVALHDQELSRVVVSFRFYSYDPTPFIPM